MTKIKSLKFDTLKEFHIQNAHNKIAHIIEHLVSAFNSNDLKEATILHHLLEKLLAELNFLKKYYSNSIVAQQLELDIEEATYLIEQLKQSFTIDDPLTWLKNTLAHMNKKRSESKLKKSALMRGLDAITQAEDTAEERKLKERRLHPQPTI